MQAKLAACSPGEPYTRALRWQPRRHEIRRDVPVAPSRANPEPFRGRCTFGLRVRACGPLLHVGRGGGRRRRNGRRRGRRCGGGRRRNRRRRRRCECRCRSRRRKCTGHRLGLQRRTRRCVLDGTGLWNVDPRCRDGLRSMRQRLLRLHSLGRMLPSRSILRRPHVRVSTDAVALHR